MATPSFTPVNFSPQDPAQIERIRRDGPVNTRFDPDSRDARSIVEFVELARANGINVLAAWPNTLRFAEYDGDPGLRAIAAFYRDLGVPMVGTPQDAMFAFEHLHDTRYHLNEAGIVERTAKLIGNLRPFLVPEPPTSATTIKFEKDPIAGGSPELLR